MGQSGARRRVPATPRGAVRFDRDLGFLFNCLEKIEVVEERIEKPSEIIHIADIAVTCVHYIVLATREYNRIHEFKKCISMMAISDSELCEVLVQGLQL